MSCVCGLELLPVWQPCVKPFAGLLSYHRLHLSRVCRDRVGVLTGSVSSLTESACCRLDAPVPSVQVVRVGVHWESGTEGSRALKCAEIPHELPLGCNTDDITRPRSRTAVTCMAMVCLSLAEALFSPDPEVALPVCRVWVAALELYIG